jgi:ParB family chromosome partitioning protein
MQQINNEKKLGRGISALFGNSLDSNFIESINSKSEDKIKYIALNKIVAGVYQPRLNFDEAELKDLCNSIKENGIIQPIIVRRADEQSAQSDVYEIIAGERRYRACKLADLEEIPAIIKDISNNQALEYAIVENIQRKDLSAIEEARGYKQLAEEFNYTQEEVSKKVGKSRSYVANILRLLNLPAEIQEMVQEGKISASHARNLIGKDDALEIANNIIDKNISVRELEEIQVEGYDYKDNLLTQNSKDSKLEEDIAKKQHLAILQDALSEIANNLKVKASYNSKKQKGKVVIYFNELEEISNLINKFKESDD